MNTTMRIGLTMAGAVSAGAYTAGVIDYMIETLLEWENAKSSADNADIPQHKVVIDVVGGTSAGGITAAIMALMLRKKGIENIETFRKDKSMLYRAWVELVDDGEQDNTFRKMITNSDIEREKEVLSLLNSDFIEQIEEKALAGYEAGKAPPFVSEDFEILLALSNLRGIPTKVDFNSDQEHRKERPAHAMFYHKMFGHFKTATAKDGEDYLRLDPSQEEDNRRLVTFAKGTSAFPIGLANRQFLQLSSDFVLKTVKKFIHPEILKRDLMHFEEDIPGRFEFTALDGGVFNNEPFVEIQHLLESRSPDANSSEIKDYAMIMVDPFPGFQEKPDLEYEHPRSIDKSFGALFGALRNQAMLKEADLLSLSEANFKRNMIYPVRYVNRKKIAGNAIACGALGGFSGFIARKFRDHDYVLGRDNCRNFLRYIFTIRYEKTNGQIDKTLFHPIHSGWTDYMIDKWGDDKTEALFLPIIPDMELRSISRKEQGRIFKEHSIGFPHIPSTQITELRDLIAERALAMINVLETKNHKPEGKKDPVENSVSLLVESLFKAGAIPTFFTGIGRWLLKGRVKKAMAQFAAKQAIQWMLADLSKNQLITEFKSDPKS